MRWGMALTAWLGIVVEVAITVVRFLLAFYAFWLVLRSLEVFVSEDTPGLDELDPLACEFTDPLVDPLADLFRLSSRAACWVWLGGFAVIEVGLTRLVALL